jgi:hypothetical protein
MKTLNTIIKSQFTDLFNAFRFVAFSFIVIIALALLFHVIGNPDAISFGSF